MTKIGPTLNMTSESINPAPLQASNKALNAIIQEKLFNATSAEKVADTTAKMSEKIFNSSAPTSATGVDETPPKNALVKIVNVIPLPANVSEPSSSAETAPASSSMAGIKTFVKALRPGNKTASATLSGFKTLIAPRSRRSMRAT